MKPNKHKTFPSIYAKMGDYSYFITTMTLADVAEWLIPPQQLQESEELKDWIQRDPNKPRYISIANYLLNQEQHFFNAIVAGIYEGDPEWFPVTVTESPTLRAMDVNVDERSKTAMGVLRLKGNEQVFAIDGQHRVEGIKLALRHNPELSNEEQCVIFVGHKSTEEGRERTKRLFTTLNRYARPVSKGEIIALDQDDAFAIVTRNLIYEYAPLKLKEFTIFTKTTNLPTNDTFAITTVLALYDLVSILGVPRTPAGSRQRSELIIGPPRREKIKEIFDLVTNFWNLLIQYIEPINAVTNFQQRASHYRRDDGGHLLFRPNGLVVFATAIRIMLDRKENLEDVISAVNQIPLELNDEPWRYVLWNPIEPVGKVITNQKTLATNLFLHMMGHKPLPPKYELEEKYQKALNDEDANIDDLPIVEVPNTEN